MDVPSNEVEQGSSQSPSIMDGISAHLSGGSETTEPVNETAIEAVEMAETPTEETAVNPEETQQEEPTSRYQQRIDELTKREADARKEAEQLQLMIASNPQMRAAYEQLMLNGQQPQGQPNGDVWYNQPQQPQESNYENLPDWDPHDSDVVRQHGAALFAEMLAPLQQQVQQMGQFYQQQQMQAAQAQRQAVVQQFDDFAFNEMPSAKDNEVHFALYNHCVREEVAKLHQMGINPSYQDIQEATKLAAARATQLVGNLSPSQPAIQPQEVKKPFAESGVNLVQPRSNEPNDTLGLIASHLNRSI